MLNEEKATEDRRWDELKFIQETLYKSWSAFLVYFIFLHSAVYGALVVLLKADPHPPPRDLVWTTVAICIVSEGLSIAVAVALGAYSKKALRRVKTIVNEGNFHAGLDAEAILPVQALNVVIFTIIASFIMGALVSLFVLSRES